MSRPIRNPPNNQHFVLRRDDESSEFADLSADVKVDERRKA
jgi:hypothetical protein